MFSKIRHTSRRKWLAGVVLMAVMVGSFSLIRFQSFAQEPDLLQLSDLPDGFVTFSEAQDLAKGDKYEDKGHIIDTANQELRGYSPEQRRVLSAYHSRQSFGAVGEASGNVVVVMHYVYDYVSPEEAAAAVEILQNDFGQITKPQQEISAEASSNASGLRGTRFESYVGPDGNVCHWFVGQRGNTLVIFFADGFDAEAVSSTYQMVWEKLSDT